MFSYVFVFNLHNVKKLLGFMHVCVCVREKTILLEQEVR